MSSPPFWNIFCKWFPRYHSFSWLCFYLAEYSFSVYPFIFLNVNLCIYFLMGVLGTELRTLCLLGMHSTTEQYPPPSLLLCLFCWVLLISTTSKCWNVPGFSLSSLIYAHILSDFYQSHILNIIYMLTTPKFIPPAWLNPLNWDSYT